MEKINVGKKTYKIETFVVVFLSDGKTQVDECLDMREAKKKYPHHYYIYRWAAAEWINEDGDLNPCVYGNTKREAISKLKNTLA